MFIVTNMQYVSEVEADAQVPFENIMVSRWRNTAPAWDWQQLCLNNSMKKQACLLFRRPPD
jgi:hypothetical protein